MAAAEGLWARWGEGLTQPLGAETTWESSSQYDGSTEGATGIVPLVSMLEERPVCQS